MKIYAGFWHRILAFGFDYLAVSLYLIFVTLVFIGINAIFPFTQWLFADRITAQLSGFLIVTLPITLYFTLGESSTKQATWGKQRLKLRVTDRNGDRIGFWRSLARAFLKFVPWELSHTLIWNIYFTEEPFPAYINYGFILVYLIIGLNIASLVIVKTKQSLYDFLSGTFVIRESN